MGIFESILRGQPHRRTDKTPEERALSALAENDKFSLWILHSAFKSKEKQTHQIQYEELKRWWSSDFGQIKKTTQAIIKEKNWEQYENSSFEKIWEWLSNLADHKNGIEWKGHKRGKTLKKLKHFDSLLKLILK